MRDAYMSFLSRVKEAKSVKIYGAGKLAKTLCYVFDRNNIRVECFIVSEWGGKSDGTPTETGCATKASALIRTA